VIKKGRKWAKEAFEREKRGKKEERNDSDHDKSW
jgi:hypothetical protein